MTSSIDPDQAIKTHVGRAIQAQLGLRYTEFNWLGSGATGYVLALTEKTLGQKRAIKILRADVPDVQAGALHRTFADYFAHEIDSLALITHENVVKVFEKGTVTIAVPGHPAYEDATVPYYIMEYVDGLSLDEHLTKYFNTMTPRLVFDLIVQLGNGLAAIHAKNILHGDVKPANIRVTKEGVLKVADFGFAKSIAAAHTEGTLWCQDRRFLHPELSAKIIRARIEQPEEEARSIIKVTDAELRERGAAWELHSIGVTIEEIVRIVEGAGSRKAFFQEGDRGFLRAAIERLVDRKQDEPWPVPHRLDSYRSAVDLAADLAKLSRPTDLGGDAPELRISYNRSLRVPLAEPIPLSPRLKKIVDHPLFQRLGSVTQLGVVNLVFRSAHHTRFEHSLGVMAESIQYLHALWNSPTSGYFRELVRQDDCEALILAALLHDLGQYPFAHAFEESEAEGGLYSHAALSRRLLSAKTPADLAIDEHSLFESNEDRERIRRLLHNGDGKLLAELIDSDDWYTCTDDVLYLLGDDDKLARPALRMLRSIVSGPIDADKMDYLRRDALHLGLPGSPDAIEFRRGLTIVPRGQEYEIALEESAVTIAQDVHMARYRMFVKVYWERVARAAERMLRYAVDGLRDVYGETTFRRMFFAQVLTSSDVELVAALRRRAEARAIDARGEMQRTLTGIVDVLDAIERRALYREAFVIDADDDGKIHERLSSLWENALGRPEDSKQFKAFSNRFLALIGQSIGTEVPPHRLLIDIPDPSTDHAQRYSLRVRTANGEAKAIETASPIWKSFADLFRLHGRRIRIYADAPIAERVAAAGEQVVRQRLNEALKEVPGPALVRRH